MAIRYGKLALEWNEGAFSRSHESISAPRLTHKADKLLRRSFKRWAHKVERRSVRLVLSDERTRRMSPCCDLHIGELS